MMGRDQEQDVQMIVRHILSGIRLWRMPADWGVSFHPSSAEEVLGWVGIQPEDPDDLSKWPSMEQRQYAESLWDEAGRVIQTL